MFFKGNRANIKEEDVKLEPSEAPKMWAGIDMV